jgi:hypothetical protein
VPGPETWGKLGRVETAAIPAHASICGWQKPCDLLQDGYTDTFEELIQSTEWEKYGKEPGNPKCPTCMVHSSYEASVVNDSFGSLKGLWATVRPTFSTTY